MRGKRVRAGGSGSTGVRRRSMRGGSECAMQVRGRGNDLPIQRVGKDVGRQPIVDTVLEASELAAERRRGVETGTLHREFGSERMRHQDRRHVHHVKLR